MRMNWKRLFFAIDGRINRAKWWLAAIMMLALAIVIGYAILLPLGLARLTMGAKPGVSAARLILILIFAYPWTAVVVKRLHDRNRPTWLVAVFWTPTAIGILGKLTGVTASIPEIGGQEALVLTPLGWIVNIVTIVIVVWMIVELGCLKGTIGLNEHGPDPLGDRA